MKFIFPQNYNFKTKFLGIIDYPTLFLNASWCGIVFLIVWFFVPNISLKVFVFISLCFPLILLSFSGFNGENVVYVFYYFLKFLHKQKLFLYKK